jgi:dTDP-4-amino-4,6-dideoxygalactose transaminase
MKSVEALHREKPMNELPVMNDGEGIVLFHPYVPKAAIQGVTEVLQSRWIGQGPRVAQFEKDFSKRFAGGGRSLAVGSGTDALHLAYLLAGLQEGDEVITPVFTCTATSIPFLYMGVKIVFADVDPTTLNISVPHVKQLISEKTKAIVCVHYGGLPCDMTELLAIANEYGIPVIEDAAHALGATYKGKQIGEISPFTMFSFQAIKHITTGDGGMLIVQDKEVVPQAERIRWFGIDRSNKQKGVWENDIWEVGYKYQMTDISAAMGLAALQEFDHTLVHRQQLFEAYRMGLKGAAGIKLIGAEYKDRTHAAWLCTALVDKRMDFMKFLRDHKIESGQVHYRNDRYSILGGRRDDLPNMDAVEENYIVLPLHMHMNVIDVEYICATIKKGW